MKNNLKSTYIAYRLLASICCILISSTALAQVTRSDYFMKSSYLRSNINPALRPNQGYLVLPFTPNVGASLQTNTLNLENLTYKLGNGKRTTFMHKDVSASEFLSNIKENNYVNADVNYKLFALGFYKHDNFWTVDLGVRTHIDASIPKSVFEMMKEGFDNSDKQVGYDLKNIGVTAKGFVELGIGYSKPFMDKTLVVGAKGKLLIGGADFELNTKQLNIEIGPNTWKAQSQVSFAGSAPGLIIKPKINSETGQIETHPDTGLQKFDELNYDKFAMAGYGFGGDIGVEYNLGKTLHLPSDLRISASLADIGFISWNDKNSVKMESNPLLVEIHPNDYTIDKNGASTLLDVFDKVVEDLTAATDLYIKPKGKRTTSLRSTLHLGAEYEIIPKKVSAGLLYSNRFGKHFNWSQLTLSGNVAPTHWFAASVGYSLLNNSYNTFGAAIHLAPSKGVRLFVASDYALIHHNKEFLPTTSTGVNFQLGISIPLGKKHN